MPHEAEVAAQATEEDDDKVTGDAGLLTGATEAGVVVAGTGLGLPAPRPVTVDVWPLIVTVDVVNWTCGTVTVVTRCVVVELWAIVKPAETPVL